MEQRTERITFRITEHELKIIEDKAKTADIQISEFVRKSVMGKEIIVLDDIKPFVKELFLTRNEITKICLLIQSSNIKNPDLKKLQNLEDKISEIWSILNVFIKKRYG